MMARLIDVEDIQTLPSPVILRTGDVLLVRASGGFVRDGATVIEQLGPFIPGSVQNDRSILSPMGSPNTVMFLAREAGQATIEVATGDPFFNPELFRVDIHVDS